MELVVLTFSTKNQKKKNVHVAYFLWYQRVNGNSFARLKKKNYSLAPLPLYVLRFHGYYLSEGAF